MIAYELMRENHMKTYENEFEIICNNMRLFQLGGFPKMCVARALICVSLICTLIYISTARKNLNAREMLTTLRANTLKYAHGQRKNARLSTDMRVK